MKYIKNIDRGQKTFLPDCIEDIISLNNPVRVIDEFVNTIDFEEIGFARFKPNNIGRPSYDPRDLLKLYIYGYFNKLRSSRKLMIECRRNIELFFLLNRLTPDFRTIADFRKDNKHALKKVFKVFVKVCMKIHLYEKELLAIDGTKIRAVNSKSNSYNKKILNEKIQRINSNISNFLQNMDELDNKEQNKKNHSKEEIKKIINNLKNRKEKYKGFLDELIQTGETQKLTTDPEARVMHSKNGFHCSYNIQTAVDKGSHLIAEYEVTNCCTDQGLLNKVAKKTKETLKVKALNVVADKGYESRKDILDCIYNGIIPDVAFKYDKNERIYNLPYIEANITKKEQNSSKPEDIKKCLSSGILPTFYENTAIELEVQEQNSLSCFILNNDGSVTCPTKNLLHRVKIKGNNTIYKNKDACRQCTNRCTGSKNPKEVSFGPNTKYVPVKMYGTINNILQEIPKNIIQSSQYNSLNRKDHIKRKVVLKIKKDKEKMKQRKCLSEHPFGTVKWHHGAYYALCKGKVILLLTKIF